MLMIHIYTSIEFFKERSIQANRTKNGACRHKYRQTWAHMLTIHNKTAIEFFKERSIQTLSNIMERK